MRPKSLAGAFFAAIVCLGVVSGQAAPKLRYHITAIDNLGGFAAAEPLAINNLGVVAGKAPDSNWIPRPFVWKDGVTRDLGIGEGEFSAGTAIDINDAGQIVATALVGNFEHGYLITSHGVVDLNEQTGLRIYPTAINANGLVAGFTVEGFHSMAISWQNGELRRLGELEAGAGSLAYDVNRWGEIVGWAPTNTAPALPELFTVVFRDGRIDAISGLGGLRINDRGEIAGSLSEATRAALYRNGRVLDLGTLEGDVRSYTLGMNNYGEVVGYSEDGSEKPRAFVFVGGVMHDLNTLVGPHSNWTFYYANAINDRGQVVGTGTFKGLPRGFLLTPIGNVRR